VRKKSFIGEGRAVATFEAIPRQSQDRPSPVTISSPGLRSSSLPGDLLEASLQGEMKF
jgi:hypothetical protein